MTRAAIFDLDGTLVDTMPLHFEAYRRVFVDLGLELTPSDFFAAVGGNASETIPRFLGGRPTPVAVDEIHRRKKALIRHLLVTEPIPVLESAHLLPLLRGRVPLALASSGSREGIEIVLERLGWRSSFDVVVTGEDVSAGKPSPEIFLLAAAGLGVPANECLVFEDTEDGVVAARRAGMEVFDVRRAAAAGWRGNAR